MLNFNYYNPCRLVFGRDAEKEAGNLAASVLGGKGRVLVVYGGGSVVRSGLLARVEEALTQAGHGSGAWWRTAQSSDELCAPVA